MAGLVLVACALSIQEYTSGWRACDPDCGPAPAEAGPPDAAADAGADSSAEAGPDGTPDLDAPVDAAQIRLMQVNDVQPDGAVHAATILLPDPQQPHDLNVVVVGWPDTVSSVTSIGDDAGNHYQLAVSTVAPATLWTPAGATQDMYYAADIAPSASNAVTVSFSGGVVNIDLRVVEFAGVGTRDVLSAGYGAVDARPRTPR